MFATLLSAIRLATRVPSSGSDQQSTSKSPSNPTDGEFPDTHINSRRGTMCLYSTQVHQGLVPTSKDPIRPRLANQHTTAVADAAGLITAPPQLRPPTTSSCSGTVVPSLGLRRPGAMHMPRTHGLDSFLHLHTGDKTHSRWTPRRLFSRKSFLVLDDVEEDGHDHYNDHDAATLLGEYSPTDELIAEKQLVTPSPEDIMQQISRKIVQNQDDLLEEEEEKSQDLTNYDWAFSHLTYDSDNEMDPDSPTYYSASDSDASGPQTPLEISYPSSCCIPAHVLLQRLVEAHSESEPVAAAAPTHVLAAAHTVNEQKLVAVDDEGREIWVTALAPAPRCPQRRAKIIGTREDGAGLCRVHKCDLPCVPCDPSVPRYIEF